MHPFPATLIQYKLNNHVSSKHTYHTHYTYFAYMTNLLLSLCDSQSVTFVWIGTWGLGMLGVSVR